MVCNAKFIGFQLNNTQKYEFAMPDFTIRFTPGIVMSSFVPCSIYWNNGLLCFIIIFH